MAPPFFFMRHCITLGSKESRRINAAVVNQVRINNIFQNRMAERTSLAAEA